MKKKDLFKVLLKSLGRFGVFEETLPPIEPLPDDVQRVRDFIADGEIHSKVSRMSIQEIEDLLPCVLSYFDFLNDCDAFYNGNALYEDGEREQSRLCRAAANFKVASIRRMF